MIKMSKGKFLLKSPQLPRASTRYWRKNRREKDKGGREEMEEIEEEEQEEEGEKEGG